MSLGLTPFLISILLLTQCRPHYHHTWATTLTPSGDPQEVAHDLGLEYLGSIGNLPDHHLFRHPSHPQISDSHAAHVTAHVMSHHHVTGATQQIRLSRKRRNATDSNQSLITRDRYSEKDITFNDPLFHKQWYLFRDMNNVTGAWLQGTTGSGVVVTILDDGLEHDHPDIAPNYDPLASRDLNDQDPDPIPRYEATNENKHGTRCAGEVAATANNGKCGVGVAFHAKIGGIRMLDGVVTDAVEASALGWNSNYVDIYSASWGPDDDGRTVDGPGYLTQNTLKRGVEQGRKGLGSLFVWASGNGGTSDDNCNCDGYTNSIWTLSIGSVSERGVQPWYSETCSSTLAVTYSSGSSKEPQVMTTDLHGKCTERHTGTSASAPLAAGIFALVLQAAPTLTWRDVQHLVVRTSKSANLHTSDWSVNSAGFEVSHQFGFGVMNAGSLVEMARLWNNVPDKSECESDVITENRDVKAFATKTFTTIVTGDCNTITYLEHVQCEVTIEAGRRGDIAIQLISPTGTTSNLLNPRRHDSGTRGFKSWPFMTVHNWGENPAGIWTLSVRNSGEQHMKLVSWKLILHGTSSLPDLRNSSSEVPVSGNDSFVADTLFRGSRNGGSGVKSLATTVTGLVSMLIVSL